MLLAGSGGPGTLLGPEGTAGWLLSRGMPAVGSPSVGGWSRGWPSGRHWFAYRAGAPVRRGGWCWRGWVWRVGRCLRTAQWTRASLNSLCGQVYKGTGWMPWH